jgi:hypothetical protein
MELLLDRVNRIDYRALHEEAFTEVVAGEHDRLRGFMTLEGDA